MKMELFIQVKQLLVDNLSNERKWINKNKLEPDYKEKLINTLEKIWNVDTIMMKNTKKIRKLVPFIVTTISIDEKWFDLK